MADSDKIEINISSISTPAGPVPSIGAIKEIVRGLNILNDEMIKNRETINDEVIKMMESVERELKSLKKLLAEETISFSALKESVGTIHTKIEKSLQEEKNNYKNLENSIDSLNEAIINLENNLESKIYSVLKKLIKPKS